MVEMRDKRLSASDRQVRTHLPAMRGLRMMMEMSAKSVHVVPQYINGQPFWQV
jgi:hypothetical protein